MLCIKTMVILHSTQPRAGARPRLGCGPTIQTFHFNYNQMQIHNKAYAVVQWFDETLQRHIWWGGSGFESPGLHKLLTSNHID